MGFGLSDSSIRVPRMNDSPSPSLVPLHIMKGLVNIPEGTSRSVHTDTMSVVPPGLPWNHLSAAPLGMADPQISPTRTSEPGLRYFGQGFRGSGYPEHGWELGLWALFQHRARGSGLDRWVILSTGNPFSKKSSPLTSRQGQILQLNFHNALWFSLEHLQ